MQIVPLQAVPNQVLAVQLAQQPCTIHVRQCATGVFVDLYVNNVLIVGGVIALNGVRLVRYAYLGFAGDLMFVDTLAPASDPEWQGLGTQFQLFYLSADEVAAL